MRTMTLLSTFLLTACHGSDAWLSPLNDVEVAPGGMAGDMPTVEPFADDLSINTAERYGMWVDLDLHIEGDYGWAMVSGPVDLWDVVDDPDQPVAYGTEVELDDDDLWQWIGCAGPDSAWADFDEQPNRVRVTFEDPKTLGLIADDAVVDSRRVGAVVEVGFESGDAVRAVTMVGSWRDDDVDDAW